MKTQAAIAHASNKPFVIEEVELCDPKEGEVRVKISACGICRSDLSALEGKETVEFPVVLGHEAAGTIEAVGNGVSTLKEGDTVVLSWTPACGTCPACIRGQVHLCAGINMTTGSQGPLSLGGVTLDRFMGLGAFCEHVVVPQKMAVNVQSNLLPEHTCLIGCGVTTGMGAVMNTAKVEAGATVAIFGLGGIGLSAVIGAAMASASRIIAIDVNESKFELARKLGATDCINPKAFNKPIQEVIVELTDGGVDYSFECIGNVDVMRSALECCHKGWGESVIIGVAGAGQEISTRPFQLVTGRVWRGTAFGGVKGRSELPGIVEDYLAGKFALSDFITHTMPLGDINTAFDLMHEGKSIRSVIHF
mgnify:CR=1 FL=1